MKKILISVLVSGLFCNFALAGEMSSSTDLSQFMQTPDYLTAPTGNGDADIIQFMQTPDYLTVPSNDGE